MFPRLLPWLVAPLLAFALAAFAWTGYPPSSTDAPGFLVTAINVARGRGLVNPLYPQATLADPSGEQRHVYHAPLFPLVVAALMPWPTPQGAFLAIAWLRAVSLLLAAWLFSRLLEGCAERGGGAAALGSASLCGLATHWIPTVGRSEALGSVLVLLAALAALQLKGARLLLALGTLAGALAAAHPIGAVELVLAAGLFLATRLETRRWLISWLALGLLSLAVFAGLLAASPHGLRDSLEGMIRAAPHTPWLVPPAAESWRAWITDRRSTFYGPLLVLSAACLARLVWRDGRGPASRFGFVLCAALFLASFYLGSLTFKSLRNYNILLLAPLGFGVVLAWRCRSETREPSRGRRLAHAAVFLVVLATGVGFLGRLAALPLFVRDHMTLAEARQAFEHVRLPEQATLAILGNLWTLSEDYERMELAPFGSEARLARRGVALVLAQRAEHHGRAPTLDGFRIVADFFNPRRALPGGLLGPFLEDDYAFAVYLPE